MSKKRTSRHKVSTQQEDNEGRRSRILQSDIPSVSLQEALRVPEAIRDHFASRPTRPLQLARAVNMQPNSGGFRMLCGAAVAYGLTAGNAFSQEIAIEQLGMRIVRPLVEGDELVARREAFLRPRIINEFLRRYDNAPIPRTDIAHNVLVELGVPQDRVDGVMSLIIEGAESLGFIQQIKDKRYVDLQGTNLTAQSDRNIEKIEEDNLAEEITPKKEDRPSFEARPKQIQINLHDENTINEANRKRVFITHGKNQAFIEPVKKLLGFGELESVVSVQRQSVSQPVPDKVINEMRSCGAAIIHVDAEQKLFDQDNKVHIVLNPNVLIEIGAALALYGRRFILLVREGIQLPSNLQGLFEVRYKGETLDGDATIRLMEAINDIKNHPLPSRYSTNAASETEDESKS